MNIYEKIMSVRVEVIELGIKKTGYNKFSNFKYYELKDFLIATTKFFTGIKLYSRFSIIPATSTNEEIATFTIINSENTEEVETYTIPTAECFIGRKKDGTGGADPIQNLGGKITYLRRYMYLLVLDLIEEDEVDSKDQSTNKKKVVKKPVKPVEEYSSLGKMSEKEAHDQATEIGLNGIMSSLNKSENIAYQDEVIKNTLVICGFDKWDNIRFDKKISYEKFLSIIKQELEKEKALATAGI